MLSRHGGRSGGMMIEYCETQNREVKVMEDQRLITRLALRAAQGTLVKRAYGFGGGMGGMSMGMGGGYGGFGGGYGFGGAGPGGGMMGRFGGVPMSGLNAMSPSNLPLSQIG